MIAYYSLIPTDLLKPSWQKPIFGINVLIGVILAAVNIYTWIPVSFAQNGQVFLYEMSLAPLWIAMIAANWIIGGLLAFLWLAYNQSGVKQVKLGLIGIGLFLMFLGGPLHTVSLSVNMQMVAEFVTLAGSLILFLGIYLDRMLEMEYLRN
jgi:hypothetical protein